ATNSQNQMNRANQTDLPKGVTFHRGVGKFQAQIKRDGKSHYLGLFDTASAAHIAYCEKAAELFGEFARAA
ncbi:HNH endonuclease, partial [Salmonella enterica subsp. enterica serovar Paratyphi A]